MSRFNSLAVRLTGAFVLIAVLTVAVVTFAVNRAVNTDFRAYLGRANTLESNADLIERLEQAYTDDGDWSGAQSLLPNMGAASGGNSGGGQGRRGSEGGSGRGAQLLVADADGKVVAATDTGKVGKLLTGEQREASIALTVQGDTVGYFLRETPGEERLASAEQQFLDEISQALLLIALGAIVLALVMGSGLAWRLSSPLRRLKTAAQSVAEGQLGAHVTPSGATEVQEVAAAFNQMSAALAESETARRRMISDIAHELRTPLSVMRGQLEGILDGVLPTNGDQVGIVYNQAMQLSRLVTDLWTLTRAEARRLPLEKSPTDIRTLVREVVQEFEPLAVDAGIPLRIEAAENLPTIEVDSGRIRQALANLLANALRYTPQGGAVTVLISQQAKALQIAVEDSGPGLSPEQISHIFERFYRTDEARQRDSGGAGLGLAIARELILLHEGQLTAESEPGRGSRFKISLPLNADSHPQEKGAK